MYRNKRKTVGWTRKKSSILYAIFLDENLTERIAAVKRDKGTEFALPPLPNNNKME